MWAIKRAARKVSTKARVKVRRVASNARFSVWRMATNARVSASVWATTTLQSAISAVSSVSLLACVAGLSPMSRLSWKAVFGFFILAMVKKGATFVFCKVRCLCLGEELVF